jgi:hypothetical protein
MSRKIPLQCVFHFYEFVMNFLIEIIFDLILEASEKQLSQ